MERKILLIHCRRAPYTTSLARGAIELAMAAAVFDQDVRLLFSGDGVWQLMDNQAGEILAEKNHAKLLSALPLYDISRIYVDSDALSTRALTVDQLCLPATPVSKTEITALLNECGQVFNF